MAEEEPPPLQTSGILALARTYPLYFVLAGALLLALPFFLRTPHHESASSSAASSDNGAVRDPAVSDPLYVASVNTSLDYYRKGQFTEAISSAKAALRVNPRGVTAYNNICASYASQKMWDEAIEACHSALLIDPGFQLAKNNLNWATNGKQGK